MKNKLTLLVLSLLLCVAALAQTPKTIKLTGLVFDKKTAKPLVGVNVSVPHSHIKKLTDKDGYFTINVLAKDTIRFSYTGFKSQYIYMAHHADGNAYDTYVVMSSEPNQLKEVTIYPRKAKTEAELRQAFMDLKVEDKDQESAQRNLQMITFEALSKPTVNQDRSVLLNDPIKQQSRGVEYQGQMLTSDQQIDLLGPVKLLIAIKEGQLKSKTYQDYKDTQK
jgi:hypothetical protein